MTELTVDMDLVTIATTKNEIDVIKVTAPRVLYDDVKKVPGSYYQSKEDCFHLPLTWASCVIMRHLFGKKLVVGKLLSEWSKNEKQTRIVTCLNLRTAKDYEPLKDTRLYDYQRPASALMQFNQYALNGDDMRIGKTPETIMALKMLSEDMDVFPCLIAAPPNVKDVWRKHLADWWPDARVEVPKSGLAASEKAIAKVKAGEADIIVIHYEVLHMLSNLEGYGSEALKLCKDCDPKSNLQPSKCQVHKKALNDITWNSVVADEVHRIGDAAALMTRALKKISRAANVRFGNTGTPPEDPERFWSVMNFIYPMEYPGKSKFIDLFADVKKNPWTGFIEDINWNEATRPVLDQFFLPRFIRRPKEAVHDVVEPIRIIREPEMSPKQAKAYKDLARTMMAEIEGGTFWSDSPLAKFARLRQLASAFGELTKDEDKETGEIKIGLKLAEPSSKLDDMEDLLKELPGESIVIMAEQKQLIELAATRLGDQAVKLVGGMSDAARNNAIEAFQGGLVPYILVTTATGGEGISLANSDTLIFLQRPWSLKDSIQSERRIYKPGRASFIIDIITPGTVETKVPEALERKEMKLEALVRDADTIKEWLK